MRNQSALNLVTLATTLLVSLSGCGGIFGPEPFKTTRVEGSVRIAKEPLRGGFIEFSPIDGTVGIMRSAPIRPDGTFVVDRVPVGSNAIAIVGGSLPSGLSGICDPLGSQIHRTITDSQDSKIDIDLLAEQASHELRKRTLTENFYR